MTVHRPLLREIRALADECDSEQECLEAAVSRGLLPEAAIADSHRKFVSTDENRMETFIAWASLGWERIATAEALATEFHRKADGAELLLRNIVWCIGGPLELGDDPAEAELVEMGLYVTLGINGQDVALHMPWRSSTGVPAIDALIGGLPEASLVVLYGRAGCFKSTITAMVAAGSEQQGRTPYYGASEESRARAYENAERQGFIYPEFRSEDGSCRMHLDAFGRSGFDTLVLGDAGYPSVRKASNVCAGAKEASRHGRGRVSIVAIHQNLDGELPSQFIGHAADILLRVYRDGDAVVVATEKHRYAREHGRVRFTIEAGGRLVWDRTTVVAEQ